MEGDWDLPCFADLIGTHRRTHPHRHPHRHHRSGDRGYGTSTPLGGYSTGKFHYALCPSPSLDQVSFKKKRRRFFRFLTRAEIFVFRKSRAGGAEVQVAAGLASFRQSRHRSRKRAWRRTPACPPYCVSKGRGVQASKPSQTTSRPHQLTPPRLGLAMGLQGTTMGHACVGLRHGRKAFLHSTPSNSPCPLPSTLLSPLAPDIPLAFPSPPLLPSRLPPLPILPRDHQEGHRNPNQTRPRLHTRAQTHATRTRAAANQQRNND